MYSSLHVETLRRYEPEKFDKAATYFAVNAEAVPKTLYFNKGL